MRIAAAAAFAAVLATAGFILAAIAQPAHADDLSLAIHQQTSPAADGRYEIVQSSLAARWTFKFDRFSGRVYQLMGANGEIVGWQEIPRQLDRLDSDIVPNKPNYQLFTSGLAVKFTFLLNVRTGATWELVEKKGGGLVWESLD